MPPLTKPPAEVESLLAECDAELFDRVGPMESYSHFARIYEEAVRDQWELIGRESLAGMRRSHLCRAALALGVIRRRWPHSFGPVAFQSVKLEQSAREFPEWPTATVRVGYAQAQAA